MNNNVMKVVKIVVPVASIALSFVASYLNKQELDETITKKVAEALAKED